MSDIKVPKPQKKDTVWTYVWIIALALFIKTVFFTIFIIPSGSMIPTFKVGDTLIVNKMRYGIVNPFYELWYKKKILFVFPNPWYKSQSKYIKNKFVWNFHKKPKRFEIIIFKAPLESRPAANYHYIAHDGREFKYVYSPPSKAGADYVKRCIGLPGDIIELRNGQMIINGEYIKPDFSWNNDNMYYGPLKVPQGHYFMMGDNRPHSSDSRYWGFVPERNIVGKATFIAFPPWHWRRFR